MENEIVFSPYLFPGESEVECFLNARTAMMMQSFDKNYLSRLPRMPAMHIKSLLSMGLLLGIAFLLSACGERDSPSHGSSEYAPDILVVLIDALRPDHLGCYGYSRNTSPFLDEWAKEALRFNHSFTNGTHTRLAIASLFTGTLPSLHRIRAVHSTPSKGNKGIHVTDGLSNTLTTCAESLKAKGYDTWGYSANPHISAKNGFDQGFTKWWETDELDGAEMVDTFTANWTRRKMSSPDKPVFVYLHLMDVHNPYAPPPPWNESFSVPKGNMTYINGRIHVSPKDLTYIISQYDGEIRYTDTLLEKIISSWEQDEMRPRATFILSDHGEEFQEHGGLGHGRTVYSELTQTALLVKAKEIPKGVSEDQVSLIDVHSMILYLAKAPRTAEARGRTPLKWEFEEPLLYSEACGGWAAYQRDTKKIIFRFEPPEYSAWFDLETDPNECFPINNPEMIDRLKNHIQDILKEDTTMANRLRTPKRVIMEEDSMEKLRQLGY